jgi:hypothetical protein
MFESSLRPLLLVTAGAVVGGLIAWGIMNRSEQARSAAPEATPALTDQRVVTPPAQKQDSEALEPSETVSPSAETANAQPTASPAPSANTTVAESNGLPLGVKPNTTNMEIYKRLPGAQPPLIDYDGRNLGPEAIQMLESPRETLPFPGANPNVSITPMPFPQTAEEANQQAKIFALPSPSPSAQ